MGRISMGEEHSPDLPIDLFFYTENKHASVLLADELNTWTYYSVEAYVSGDFCVIAVAERSILENEEPLEAIAKRYAAVFDGHGTSMRGG